MPHVLIGTAGHVDHGKTALIKALTGMDTDRLPEEKERGMSIELGFAYFDLPDGSRAGIVDVPGHERFLKNMLIGAYAMDVVLLVIDATEGVMPQTVEHLEILNLLGARAGILVITKVDLADEEMLELVEEEAREVVRGSVLEGAPLVRVSSVTGQGLEELKRTIVEVVQRASQLERPLGVPRLYVDRVFPVAGFGVVVTGTLLGGEIHREERVLLQPKGLEARVRSIQNHGRSVEVGFSGQRLALNLAGLQREQVERGDVVCPLEVKELTLQVDVRLQLLERLPRALRHWTRVRFYIGTREVFGRVALIGREEAPPGSLVFAQIRLEEPILAFRGDRFILRDFPAQHTLGGGVILDPFPPRHRRHAPETLERFRRKDRWSAGDTVLAWLEDDPSLVVPGERVLYYLPRRTAEREGVLRSLEERGEVMRLRVKGKERWVARRRWEAWRQEVEQRLQRFHEAQPLALGMNLAVLQQQWAAALGEGEFEGLIEQGVKEGRWVREGPLLRLPEHRPRFSEKEEALRQRFLTLFRAAGFSPPSLEEALQGVENVEEARQVFRALAHMGELVEVAQGLFFHPKVLEEGKECIRQRLREQPSFTVADFRNWVNTSRKYAVPLLEYYDRIGFTRRIGNDRVLRE